MVRFGNHLIHLHLKNNPPIGFIHVINITINNTIAEGRIKAFRHLKKAIYICGSAMKVQPNYEAEPITWREYLEGATRYAEMGF